MILSQGIQRNEASPIVFENYFVSWSRKNIMSTKLPAPLIKWVIRHIHKFGDTDIFPRLPEIELLAKHIEISSQDFASQDLSNYRFRGGITHLAPKGNLGFNCVTRIRNCASRTFGWLAKKLWYLSSGSYYF